MNIPASYKPLDLGVELVLNFSSTAAIRANASDTYIHEEDVVICASRPGKAPRKVGNLHFCVADVAAMVNAMARDRVPAAFGANQAMAELAPHIFDREGYFKKATARATGDPAFNPLGWGVLLVTGLQIDLALRGAGLGLLVLREVLRQRSSGLAIAAIRPAPLAGDAQTEAMRNEQDAANARRKLAQHLRKLDFHALPRTGFMLRRGYDLPSAHELAELIA